MQTVTNVEWDMRERGLSGPAFRDSSDPESGADSDWSGSSEESESDTDTDEFDELTEMWI